MLCKELESVAEYLDIVQDKFGDDLSAEFGELGVTCERQTVVLPKVGGGYVRLELLKLFRTDGGAWHSCTFPLSVEIVSSLPA
ncbi:MAG: hypothetical protein L6Q71_00015 [Planctomycetes bacterium]|nr:hypothetical protein [Planctomycetota bacterium]NUQ33885.1 hypothetical protein [Planctomycetaceae bacterium]